VLTDVTAVSIAVALIQPRLDYANSVCYGIGLFVGNLAKLQRVQNFAARIVAHHQSTLYRSSQLASFLYIYWLPIKHRINFKTATLTHL